jgi:hypothetical protein
MFAVANTTSFKFNADNPERLAFQKVIYAVKTVPLPISLTQNIACDKSRDERPERLAFRNVQLALYTVPALVVSAHNAANTVLFKLSVDSPERLAAANV